MLSAEPTSVSTKPSVPHAEASWSVIVFSVTVIKYTKTLNCLIEHLEEELKIKHQNSITSVGLRPGDLQYTREEFQSQTPDLRGL